MKRSLKASAVSALLLSSSGSTLAFTSFQHPNSVQNPSPFRSSRIRPAASELWAKQGGFTPEEATTNTFKQKPLQAVAISAQLEEEYSSTTSFLDSFVLPVLSAALLITGNTFGAGCLVLPDLAAGPGLLPSAGVFVGAYLMNLMSGLVLAEVAIKQKEASGNEVPSSFKEFAETNLQCHTAANVISGLSLFVNTCVMAFILSRAGDVGSHLVGLPAPIMSMGWAALVATVLATQTSSRLSNVASLCVTALFVSFGGLLLPGIAAVQDPMATILQPGTAEDTMGSLAQAAPVVLMAMIYQNIVPSITKILDYDRVKSVTAIVLGSMIPLTMYTGWCYACIGGGIDTTVGLEGGLLMTVFSLATLAGSSIGSTMSLAEELESFSDEKKGERFQLPTVLVSIAAPLAAALFLANGQDFTAALEVAGSFGSPLLYGLIPALMAWNQRRNENVARERNLVPAASLGILGLASTGFVGEELMQYVGDALSFAI